MAPRTRREDRDDDPRVRDGVALAADRVRDLARIPGRRPERPHPAAAGVDRAEARVGPAGASTGGGWAGGRRGRAGPSGGGPPPGGGPAGASTGGGWPGGRRGRAGLRAAGPRRGAAQALRVPRPRRPADLLQPAVRVLHEDADDLAALPQDAGGGRAMPLVVTMGDPD